MAANNNREESSELMEARALREKKATELYSTSKAKDPQKHKRLEKEFNQANEKVHRLEGATDSYVYRRDVREEFSFSSKNVTISDGSQRRVETAEGPLYSPDTVINWRNTEVGEKADKNTRAWARKQYGATNDGDDVGHRIMVSQGVDPAERRNVGMQNHKQNRGGGTYHVSESEARQIAKDHSDKDCRITVRESYHDQKYGGNRSVARDVQITDYQGSRLNSEKVRYGNFRYQGSEAAKKAQAESPRSQQTPPTLSPEIRAAHESDAEKTQRELKQHKQDVQERQSQLDNQKEAANEQMRKERAPYESDAAKTQKPQPPRQKPPSMK